jgi:antitoxin component YwqK of YwqJK toxin-antitoxin module
MNYHNDLQHGKTVRYHPNGKVEIAENYIDCERDGSYERYNEGCYPEEKGTFVKGRKQGKWIWFDKYGNEGIVAQFKDGFMTSMEDKTAKKQDSKDSRRR